MVVNPFYYFFFLKKHMVSFDWMPHSVLKTETQNNFFQRVIFSQYIIDSFLFLTRSYVHLCSHGLNWTGLQSLWKWSISNLLFFSSLVPGFLKWKHAALPLHWDLNPNTHFPHSMSDAEFSSLPRLQFWISKFFEK